MKIKENEKKDEYFDLARELKKLWNMKVTMIPILTGVQQTIPTGLVRCLEKFGFGGRAETIQTTALLRSARILRIVLEIWGNLLFFRIQLKDQ